ncbi:MAG: EutN/CcmL family microcompartment protein [Opitutales bacterium]|jgi:ethanolamine utilization protein EutN|nr:EutN/CcmL family microcompartment protein [Opitutales bacterium]
MFLAKVIGNVVATQKDDKLRGSRLLVLRPLQIEEGGESSRLADGKNTVVAVDACGAGVGQVVLYCQGSSARQTSGMKELPIDAAVIGLVDKVEAFSKEIYKSQK